MNLCECGCGREVKEGNRFINHHNRRGQPSWSKEQTKFTDERLIKRSETMKMLAADGELVVWSKGHVPWNKDLTAKIDDRIITKENSAKARRRAEKMILLTEKSWENPIIRRKRVEGLIAYHKRPGVKENMSLKIKKSWEVPEIRSKRIRPPWNKDLTADTDARVKKYVEKGSLARRGMKQTKESVRKRNETAKARNVGFFNSETQKVLSRKGMAARRAGCPYFFMGVPFDSNEEREVAIWLNRNKNFIPQEGINCHIPVNGGEIDFHLEDLFLEYHPCYRESREDYFNKRRKLLDENGYKNSKLILAETLDELVNLL